MAKPGCSFTLDLKVINAIVDYKDSKRLGSNSESAEILIIKGLLTEGIDITGDVKKRRR